MAKIIDLYKDIRPDDFVTVMNIDVNCDEYEEYEMYEDYRDPNEPMKMKRRFYQEGYNHRDKFQVMWDREKFSVKPGQTRRFPGYIARMFVKHLTDHMLNKEDPKGEKNYLRNQTKRQELYNKIIVDIESLRKEPELTEGQKATKQVEELNIEEKVEESVSEPEKVQEPSIQELRNACKKQNIEYKVTESKKDLIKKLK